jgi:hypothetical protein
MRVDGNIGGAIDGTGGGDLAGIAEQVAAAERTGYDGSGPPRSAATHSCRCCWPPTGPAH